MHNIDSDSEDELPSGWEQKSTEDGSVYFINTCTNKTQWTHPRTGRKKEIPKELPFGWTKTVDEEDKPVYVQKDTGQKTYVDPRLAFATDAKEHVHDFRQRFDASSTAFQGPQDRAVVLFERDTKALEHKGQKKEHGCVLVSRSLTLPSFTELEGLFDDFPSEKKGPKDPVLHGVDLSGKYALVTGSNAGIGYETAKSLARHGCNVLFANRNMESTQQAIRTIVQETKASEDDLKSIHLDLTSLQSVKKCAAAIKTVFSDHLDIVILNAGVFGLPYIETEDNIETTCQVNHVSHLYFAILLEPLLRKGSRVIFVSSESHRFADLKNVFTLQNIAMPKDAYSSMMAYNNSKLYNVITAKVLSEEWRSKGIYVNSLHPGNMVYTNLCKSWWLFRLAFFIVRPFTKSLQQGAATSVYAATAAELEGVTGLYFNNCFYCEESAMARDKNIAHELFAMTLKMIAARVGTDGLQKYLDKYTTTQPLSKDETSGGTEQKATKE